MKIQKLNILLYCFRFVLTSRLTFWICTQSSGFSKGEFPKEATYWG